MFCPRCSREQSSEEIRFCNGCGFRLTDIAEALRNEGQVVRAVSPDAREFKKSVAKALVVMTLSAVFFLLSLILGTPEPSYFVQLNMSVGILCYLFGLVWIASSFWKETKKTSRHADEDGRHSLPDKESTPRLGEPDLSSFVDADTLARDTPEQDALKTAPPSVTEEPTKLL